MYTKYLYYVVLWNKQLDSGWCLIKHLQYYTDTQSHIYFIRAHDVPEPYHMGGVLEKNTFQSRTTWVESSRRIHSRAVPHGWSPREEYIPEPYLMGGVLEKNTFQSRTTRVESSRRIHSRAVPQGWSPREEYIPEPYHMGGVLERNTFQSRTTWVESSRRIHSRAVPHGWSPCCKKNHCQEVPILHAD